MIHGYLISGGEKYPVCAPGMDGLEIRACSAKFNLNEVDSASLTLPASNRAAQAVAQKNSILMLYDAQECVFIGDVAQATLRETGETELELDGALGWLQSVCRAPFTAEGVSAASFLSSLFTAYNNAVESDRIVQLGTVTVSGTVDMDHAGEYTCMLDLLREVVEQCGGYFYVSYGSEIPTVHYVDVPSDAAVQEIALGANVLTLERQLDFSEYASRVYATGTYQVEVADGSSTRTEDAVLDAGYVIDRDAEKSFGRADCPYRSATSMRGEDGAANKTYAEARAIIRAEAQEILDERCVPLRSLTMTALDLAELGLSDYLLPIGTVASANLRPLLDTSVQMIVQSVRRDYLQRENSVITLGKAPRALTGMI